MPVLRPTSKAAAAKTADTDEEEVEGGLWPLTQKHSIAYGRKMAQEAADKRRAEAETLEASNREAHRVKKTLEKELGARGEHIPDADLDRLSHVAQNLGSDPAAQRLLTCMTTPSSSSTQLEGAPDRSAKAMPRSKQPPPTLMTTPSSLDEVLSQAAAQERGAESSGRSSRFPDAPWRKPGCTREDYSITMRNSQPEQEHADDDEPGPNPTESSPTDLLVTTAAPPTTSSVTSSVDEPCHNPAESSPADLPVTTVAPPPTSPVTSTIPPLTSPVEAEEDENQLQFGTTCAHTRPSDSNTKST